jgi:F-type H+-transporting ATPase subunit b
VKILDERQDKIRESLASAERMQQELKATQSRNEEVLLEARREAQDIVANARQSGEQLLAKAREEANVQAETYLTRAQETLRQESEQARQQLRSEVVDIATLAAGRILKKELNPDAQRQLIEETLSGASQASQN